MCESPAIRGQMVAQLRRGRGLTQAELARRADVDQAMISRIEAGKQRDVLVSTLVALADALDVEPSALIARDDDKSEDTDDHSFSLADRVRKIEQHLGILVLV